MINPVMPLCFLYRLPTHFSILLWEVAAFISFTMPWTGTTWFIDAPSDKGSWVNQWGNWVSRCLKLRQSGYPKIALVFALFLYPCTRL